MPQTKRRSKGSGSVRQLRSGRWQARFKGPDGLSYTGPVTFDTKLDASMWLAAQHEDVKHTRWAPPERRETARLRAYAATWLEQRRNKLKPRTREHYRKLLDRHVLPVLGDVPLDRLTPTTVRNWHANLGPDTPVMRAHAYSLLRAICTTAFADGLIDANPCRVESAGVSKRRHDPRPATLPELQAVTEAMPGHYQAMVLIAAWCGLRFGELTELRRSDVDLGAGVLHVRRAVARAAGEVIVGDPKSDAGRRTVAIPPHLLEPLRHHLDEYVEPGEDALLFAGRGGQHLAPSTLWKAWNRARVEAGRPDLRFHDLRHTAALLAATTGATLAELMARLGHSTHAAAMRYQHAAADRDRVIAEALSVIAAAAE